MARNIESIEHLVARRSELAQRINKERARDCSVSFRPEPGDTALENIVRTRRGGNTRLFASTRIPELNIQLTEIDNQLRSSGFQYFQELNEKKGEVDRIRGLVSDGVVDKATSELPRVENAIAVFEALPEQVPALKEGIDAFIQEGQQLVQAETGKEKTSASMSREEKHKTRLDALTLLFTEGDESAIQDIIQTLGPAKNGRALTRAQAASSLKNAVYKLHMKLNRGLHLLTDREREVAIRMLGFMEVHDLGNRLAVENYINGKFGIKKSSGASETTIQQSVDPIPVFDSQGQKHTASEDTITEKSEATTTHGIDIPAEWPVPIGQQSKLRELLRGATITDVRTPESLLDELWPDPDEDHRVKLQRLYTVIGKYRKIIQGSGMVLTFAVEGKQNDDGTFVLGDKSGYFYEEEADSERRIPDEVIISDGENIEELVRQAEEADEYIYAGIASKNNIAVIAQAIQMHKNEIHELVGPIGLSDDMLEMVSSNMTGDLVPNFQSLTEETKKQVMTLVRDHAIDNIGTLITSEAISDSYSDMWNDLDSSEDEKERAVASFFLIVEDMFEKGGIDTLKAVLTKPDSKQVTPQVEDQGEKDPAEEKSRKERLDAEVRETVTNMLNEIMLDPAVANGIRGRVMKEKYPALYRFELNDRHLKPTSTGKGGVRLYGPPAIVTALCLARYNWPDNIKKTLPKIAEEIYQDLLEENEK